MYIQYSVKVVGVAALLFRVMLLMVMFLLSHLDMSLFHGMREAL